MKTKRSEDNFLEKTSAQSKIKRIVRPIICASLAAAVAFSSPVWLSAEKPDESGTLTAYAAKKNKKEKVDKTSMRWVASYGNLKMYKPEATLDPDKILKDIEYEKEFLVGEYNALGAPTTEKDKVKEFYNEHKKHVEYSGYEITALPIAYRIDLDDIDNEDCRFEFAREDGFTNSVYGSIELNGRKLTFTPQKRSYDEDEKPVAFVYDVELKGGTVTLTYEKDSTVLTHSELDANVDSSLYFYSKEAKDGKKIDNIKAITISRDIRENSASGSFSIDVDDSDDRIYNVCGYLYENGLFDFSWSDYDGTVHAYEYVYFLLGYDGIILTDGTNTYYYTEG